ncbi:integrase [Yersinia thracica]|uniref:Integrase n=2 Tax=Yersinia thracica TaxID=2890319 RepID=A0A0T9NUW3_9GAMM|nr:integrase [Yersinia thracica]
MDVRPQGSEEKALICLMTGGRWGNTAGLKGKHVFNKIVNVHLYEKKSGKQISVSISSELFKLIKIQSTGLLFESNPTKTRRILRIMKSDIPDGQTVHILRHTFTTHFIMNGGNIITLQRIPGHSTIQQTMASAHYAPDCCKMP